METYISTVTFITPSLDKYSYREVCLNLLIEAFSDQNAMFLESFQTGFHAQNKEEHITGIFITIIHPQPLEAHKKSPLMRELETNYKTGQILTRFNKKGLDITQQMQLGN
jgi:hypothetical protein